VKIVLVLLFSLNVMAKNEAPLGLLETRPDYQIDFQALGKGNYQYFYGLIRPEDGEESKKIAALFQPLDTKKLWDPKDGNYLAVAKFTYLLPTDIKKIDEAKLTSKDFLQKTLPNYKVTKHDNYFHVGGSFMTPDFNVYLTYLNPDHPFTKLISDVNIEKMRQGKMKVLFMHQDSFGRVMMFRTAKMASSMTIYQEHDSDLTLVTQYILSNIINVPTENLIRKGMIENLQNVVHGSRQAVKDF
jgi:hypothetical protein